MITLLGLLLGFAFGAAISQPRSELDELSERLRRDVLMHATQV